MRVTAHFEMSEFNCKDGTPVPVEYQGNVVALCLALEQLRVRLGEPVTIVSGYRTVLYNEEVGGAPKSQHLTASAADVRVPRHTPEKIAQCFEEMISNGIVCQGGLGVYSIHNFVHYDIRLYRARWGM
tara:strand:+ start:1125 stop:1508 length:384 start_codon:yes stop_codon:yes gene_type:complete